MLRIYCRDNKSNNNGSNRRPYRRPLRGPIGGYILGYIRGHIGGYIGGYIRGHLGVSAGAALPAAVLSVVALCGCGPSETAWRWHEVPSRCDESGSHHRFWASSVVQEENIADCRKHDACEKNIPAEELLTQFCRWIDSAAILPAQLLAMDDGDSFRCAHECQSDRDCEYFSTGAKCIDHLCSSRCWARGSCMADRGDGLCVDLADPESADLFCPGHDAESFGVSITHEEGADGGSYSCTPEIPDPALPNEQQFIDIPEGILTFQYPVQLNSSPYTSYNAGDMLRVGAFQIWKTPVTVAQFKQCVDAGACRVAAYNTNGELCNYSAAARQDHPMNCLSPLDAVNFCRWTKARLPTPEEWIYAATHDGVRQRMTEYPWGNSFPEHCRTANFYAVQPDAAGTQNYYCYENTEVAAPAGTSPVGLYSPGGDSPLGLKDMLGNVREIVDVSNKYYVIGAGFATPMRENDVIHYLYSLSYYGLYSYQNDAGFRCVR